MYGSAKTGNEFRATGLLFESVCTDNYALLVQTDLPESGPKLRITVTCENKMASYEPAYDGKGDTVYPLVKNGVLLEEAPFSAAAGTSGVDDFQTVLA